MTIQEIKNLIEEGESLKVIAQAYSEIANLKIKRIRSEVERNRLFFAEISKVYGLVKAFAKQRKVSMPKAKKRVCAIITSNYRFYGQIHSDLIRFFINFVSQMDSDVILIGRAAIDYFKSKPVLKTPQEIILKSDLPGALELAGLVKIIKDYNQVLIFHSRLKSLLVQQPVFTDITASSDTVLPAKEGAARFIFEPELLKILNFFDTQILTQLLEATFLESEVSRTASRFISMDQAETEANKFISEYRMLKAYTERNIRNNQLLEGISTILAVRKEE